MASNYNAEITTPKDFFDIEKPKNDVVIRQGYNVEFVEKEKVAMLGLDTECSICMLVMRDPMLTIQCGHSYCNTCLEDWMRSCDGPILCPLDKTVIDKNQIVPDLRLRRILGAMKVFCLNKDDGCDHTPELIHLEAHSDGCQYKKIGCSLCGVRLTRGTLDLHSKKECQGRLPDKINTHEASLLLNMVTELGTEVDRANEKIALLMVDNVKLQQANEKLSELDAKLSVELDALKQNHVRPDELKKLSNELGALKQANVQLTHELDRVKQNIVNPSELKKLSNELGALKQANVQLTHKLDCVKQNNVKPSELKKLSNQLSALKQNHVRPDELKKLSNELGALKQANVQLTHELDVKLSDDVSTLKKKIDIIEEIAFKSEGDTLPVELNIPDIPKASVDVVTGVEGGAKVGYINEIFCNKSEGGGNRCPLVWRVELAKCTSEGDYRWCDEFCAPSGSRMCMKIEYVGNNEFKLMGLFTEKLAIPSWSCVENVRLSVKDAETGDKICVRDVQGMSITELEFPEKIAYCFQCILSFTLDRNRILDIAMDTCVYVPNEMIGDRNERVEQLICEVTPDGKYKLPCTRWLKGNVETTISESFYTEAGYNICMSIRVLPNKVSPHGLQDYYLTVNVSLMKGENDSMLMWPFKYKFFVTRHDEIYEKSASICHTQSDNVWMFNIPSMYTHNMALVGVSITEGNQITIV